MHDLLAGIAQANETEISDLLQAVIRRYAQLFPEWELGTISIEKSGDRNAQIDQMILVLQSMKNPRP
jgi:hypothetical protein